ncbi:MAG: 50S ribosomal protein L11 methyltransferase [Thermoleophilia bacterium]
MSATATQASGAVLPPGLLVRVPAAVTAGDLAGAWPALAPLQPVARTPEGVLCAPRCAPEAAAAALPRLAWPWEPLAAVPGWPDPPSAMLGAAGGGWYRRSPGHLAAPAGVRELVQVPGEGFGPIDHATTAMCLDALAPLPAGPAVDAGCGSGLLAQAWAALGRGPVLAVDVDPHAVRHAAASAAAAGLAGTVTVRRGQLATLTPADLAGAVLLANVPAPAHRELLHAAAGAAVAAVVLSGIRPGDAPALRDAWAARGLRPDGAWQSGGFACLRLATGPDAG